MKDTLERIRREFDAALQEAGREPRAVDDVRVRFLGRKGQVTALMKELGKLPKDQRREAGQSINELKQLVEGRIESAVADAESAATDAGLASELSETEAGFPSRATRAASSRACFVRFSTSSGTRVARWLACSIA